MPEIRDAHSEGQPARTTHNDPLGPFGIDWKIALTPTIAVAWLLAILMLIAIDVVRSLPERPPTLGELSRDGPAAQATWMQVYTRLQRRLPAWQPRPPELGAVWSTRSGEVCGLVDEWHTGLDRMTRFYTVQHEPYFREENLHQYIRSWNACLDHPWVLLHRGTEVEGTCAAAAGRRWWPSLCGRD